MRRINRRRSMAVLTVSALALCLLPPAVAAAVGLRMETSAPSVQAGDTVDVIITVSGSSMAIAEGSFAYDPTVLTYTESDGGASDGYLNMVSVQKGGADTLTARIRFTAIGAGEAGIAASITNVLGYDGAEQEGAKADVSISVSAPAPTPAPTPLNYAAEGVRAQHVKGTDTERYIWRTLENVTIPSRYSETTLDYHGETVAAAQVEDSDAPTLLYLSNAAGDVGGYYIYDATADTLYPYQTLSSVSKTYILMEPDGTVALPEGFSEMTLVLEEKEYPAWQSADGTTLVYARNPDGETGFYLYSVTDEAIQRYAVLPAKPLQPTLPSDAGNAPALDQQDPAIDSQETKNGIVLDRLLFFVLIGVCVLLFISMAGLLLLQLVDRKRRRARLRQTREQHTRAMQSLHEQDQDM